MDYKDVVVIGAAFLGSAIGATYAGPVGFIAGLLCGAGVASAWAYQTDLQECLLERQL